MLNYCVSPLAKPVVPSVRLGHLLATRSPARFLLRAGQVVSENIRAAFQDFAVPLKPKIFEVSPGHAPPSRSFALYPHWSPGGQKNGGKRM